MRAHLTWFLVVVAALIAPAAQASSQAVVVGDTGAGNGNGFADAYYAAQAVKAWTGAAPVLHRNASYDAVTQSLNALADQQQGVLYFAAPTAGGQVLLDGRAFDLEAYVARFFDGSDKTLVLLFEDCARSDGQATPLPQVSAPVAGALVVAQSATPQGVCPADDLRMSDVLKHAARAGQGAPDLAAYVRAGDIANLRSFVRERPEERATGGSAVQPSLTASTAVIAPVSSAVSTASISAVSATSEAARVTSAFQPQQAQETVVVFTAPPSQQIRARRRAAGLPKPSIIVGLIDGVTEASFAPAQTVLDPSGNEIGYDTVAARQRLRRDDPELFASLVAGGAFDPPGEVLASALQTELARMGCYTSRIDGDWGRGSRGAMARYFDETGDRGQSVDPTIELFRRVISQDDVTCAAPVAAAPRAGRTSRPTSTTTTRARPTRQAQPSAPAAPTRSPGTIAPGAALTGVFR